jgi:membrane associated rhomboid family serine protease
MEVLQLLVIIVGLFVLMLLLWAFIDIVKRTFKDNTEKALWILIILFIPFVGSVFYLIFGRKNNFAP